MGHHAAGEEGGAQQAYIRALLYFLHLHTQLIPSPGKDILEISPQFSPFPSIAMAIPSVPSSCQRGLCMGLGASVLTLLAAPRITSKGSAEPLLPPILKQRSILKVKRKLIHTAPRSLSPASHTCTWKWPCCLRASRPGIGFACDESRE